jgi:hypothetical protein
MTEKSGIDEHGTWVISSLYDNRPRKLYRYRCENPSCNTWFLAPKHAEAKYCSKSCAVEDKSRKNSFKVNCSYCGRLTSKPINKKVRSKTGKFYCNKTCKDLGHMYDSEVTYRSKALHFYGESCNRCGYELIEKMLDVHHKDGNRSNNTIENLEVLCVWCHALETRNVPLHSNNGQIDI